MARFLHKRTAGKANTRSSITEWVGPPCLIPGIRRSMSGSIESVRANGMLILVSRNFDEAFPVM